MRVFISVASNRDWKWQFGSSLNSLVSHLTQIIMKGGQLTDSIKLDSFHFQNYAQCSCLSEAKEHTLQEALNGNFTHWLALDDDMSFPEDIVEKLAIHQKDVVTVNVRRKIPEIKGNLHTLAGQLVDSTGKTGLEEISTIGGSIFLLNLEAIKNIPPPHFEVRWLPEHKQYIGEDVYFATLLQQHGIHMFCDHDTTKLVGHIGDTEYRWS